MLCWTPIEEVLARLRLTPTVRSTLFWAPSEVELGTSRTPRSTRLPPEQVRFWSVTLSAPTSATIGSFEVVMALDSDWLPQDPASVPRVLSTAPFVLWNV